jgi:hypothetical protein
MPIGPDVLVFVSATKALLQSLPDHPLNEEERAELECCLRELTALLSDQRDAAMKAILNLRSQISGIKLQFRSRPSAC